MPAPANRDASPPGPPERDESERVPFSKLLRDGVARGASASRQAMRHVRSRAETVGQMPGEVTFVGDAPEEPPRLTVLDYDAQHLAAYEPDSAHDLYPLRDQPTTTWINLDGLHDTTLIEELGAHFGLHPLVLEDIANTGQRPKVEAFPSSGEEGAPPGHLFAVIKMLTYDDEARALRSEQVSLAAGPGWLLSFQERAGDVFDPVRKRLHAARGRIRGRGSDYLAYALLDVIVDHYFLVLEAFGTRTEEIEEDIVTNDPPEDVQRRLNRLRHDLIQMRRAVWPTRDLFATLERGGTHAEESIVAEDVRPFLRDTYDHAVQVMDILESLRDVVSGLSDLHMSALSHRMNEVMQVLTIIGTIFIPLTFIAGIYGMNFEYIPELTWHYSYFVAMGGMGLIGVTLLLYFRKKGWL